MKEVLLFMLLVLHAVAQQAPPTPARPWKPPRSAAQPSVSTAGETAIDNSRVYTLPELIDLAERHNPETRVAWEAAWQRHSELRIAQGDWFPTLTAIALANTQRAAVLFGDTFVRQTLGLFEPFLRVNYTVVDFGRTERIAAARQQAYAAGFAFNTTHLGILFNTARLYYGYLNALGQQQAAEVSLKQAQTVQSAVEARLKNGLATLPDALEARAAAAQADYELQAAIGESQIARGALLDEVGANPASDLQVQPLDQLALPGPFDEQANDAIERALKQRPELAQHLAEKQAAEASIASARRAYLPSISFSGDGGNVRGWGQQDLLPSLYVGPLEVWNTSLSLEWRLFDGGRREAELARAHHEERQAQAEIDATRDAVELEVWSAYINLRTAYRQRDAAAALLTAAQASYDAALQSYQFGVRNTIDVLNAQRSLALAIRQDVAARAGLLTQSAAFAFRTGDLLIHSTTGAPRP